MCWPETTGHRVDSSWIRAGGPCLPGLEPRTWRTKPSIAAAMPIAVFASSRLGRCLSPLLSLMVKSVITTASSVDMSLRRLNPDKRDVTRFAGVARLRTNTRHDVKCCCNSFCSRAGHARCRGLCLPEHMMSAHESKQRVCLAWGRCHTIAEV